MSSLPESLQDRFAALQAAFLQQMRERMAEIDLLWPTARASRNPADLKPLYIHVHSLCGSSAPLGFPEISEAAQQADAFLRPLANASDPFPADCISRIESLLETLRIAAGNSTQVIEPGKIRTAS